MAEEQIVMEPVSFQEINAQHMAGDPFAAAPVAQAAAADAPVDGLTKTDPPAPEPVNWETKYKEVETNFTKKEQEYQAKLKEHEAKIEEISKKAPPSHKDSDLSRLEVVKLNSPEKFDLYTKLLFSKPNAADLWKLDFIEKNPSYADKPEMVDMLLQDSYAAYFDEDADPESKEYKIAAAKLEIAGEQIKAAKMAEFKAIQVSDPAVAEQTQKQQREALAKSWEITFTDMTKNPLKVSQKIALDDKSEIEVDFGVQPEDSKKFNEAMGIFILHNNLAPTAENAAKARNYATGEIIREKFPEILKSVIQKDRATQWEAFQKTRNNSHPLAPTHTASDGKKSTDQSVLEMLEHGETYVPGR